MFVRIFGGHRLGQIMEKKTNKNKQRFLKSSVVLVSVGMLSACQLHTKPDLNAQFAKTAGATVAPDFAKVGNVQEKHAKQQLTGAMKTLLNSERTTTTEYHYQAQSAQMSDKKTDLNAGADSLFTSILKVFGYRSDDKSETAPEAFRTMADYTPLNAEANELYLRYYDEVEGKKPSADYATKRLDGMSERMQATDAVIYQLNKGYQSCVQSFSYEVDGLVGANPAVTSDDKAFKSALAHFDSCTKEQDTIANRLRSKDISAYHRQDIAMAYVCASNYRRSLTDALSPKRTQKRYDKKDGSYDAYDSVYAQYGICHSVFMNGYRSDPVVYINNGDSKLRLEGLKAARQCGIEFTDGVATLYGAGMSYRTHAKEQQGLVYAHMDCLMDSAEKLYNEDGEYTHAIANYTTPKNRTELSDSLKLYQEIASRQRVIMPTEETKSSRLGAWFDKYFSMKKEELSKQEQADTSPDLDGLGAGIYGKMADEVIKSMTQTPAQIAATNYYAYNNTKITVLTKHNPKNYHSDVMVSVDFESPTATQSVQLPFSQDYQAAKLAVDVNALLPVMAVLAPEQTPLAQSFTGEVGVMNFALPKELQGVIPMSLVYDSVIQGFVAGLDGLHNSHFSLADTRQDSFAKKQGASHAIKLTLNLQQSGELLASISKQVIKDLSDYVEKNPQVYAEKPLENLGVADSIATKKSNEQKQKIKNAIEKWALLDKGFVSADVGGLFQVIEGILPINYYQTNYYYFDNQGQLVGQLVRQDIDDHASKMRTKMLAMTSFKTKDFDNHHLAKKVGSLTSHFGFDGNAWLIEQKQVAEFKKDAKALRAGYTSDGADTTEQAK